jgi:hypothetical protein
MDGSLRTAKHLAPGYATPSLGGVTGSTRLVGPSLVTKRRCRKPLRLLVSGSGLQSLVVLMGGRAGRQSGGVHNARYTRACRSATVDRPHLPYLLHLLRRALSRLRPTSTVFSCSGFGRSHRGRRPGVSAPWARHVTALQGRLQELLRRPGATSSDTTRRYPEVALRLCWSRLHERLANDPHGLETAC